MPAPSDRNTSGPSIYDRCESCGRFYPIFGWTNWLGWCTNPQSPRYRIVIDRDEQPCGHFTRDIGALRIINGRVQSRNNARGEAADGNN